MFKAKLFKLGNSMAIYVPKEVYQELQQGKEYEWKLVVTDFTENIIQEQEVIPTKDWN